MDDVYGNTDKPTRHLWVNDDGIVRHLKCLELHEGYYSCLDPDSGEFIGMGLLNDSVDFIFFEQRDDAVRAAYHRLDQQEYIIALKRRQLQDCQ